MSSVSIFDEIIDRKNTNSLKYDFTRENGMPEDVLPMWVADMDFRIPPVVTDALIKSAEHSIFGYSEAKEDYFLAIRNWFLSGFGFELKPEWMVKAPGVVFGICMAIRAFTEQGDGILIQTPVYHPFEESIRVNDREVVNNPLVYKGGRYQIDLEDFEKKIIENNVKMFILCSPHNPVGRVWTRDELIAMGDICLRHGVLVVSDEIHCDFVYEGVKHHMFPSLKPDYLENCILCTAPSKTFNLAGLQISNIFIANNALKKKFVREIEKTGYSQLNTMGLLSCQSAYENGREWLDELKLYLAGNLALLRSSLSENLPMISLVEPEGTYLAWLDFKSVPLSERELEIAITREAKLWLSKGSTFGKEGNGFWRMNIACPRENIKRAFLQATRIASLFQ